MCGSSGGPKRSESMIAMGRAPMVKMSRRMPPTPVAAPWYGSMNEGWLCGLDLEHGGQAVPDVDRARVFARALQRRAGPAVGSVFRWMRLLL